MPRTVRRRVPARMNATKAERPRSTWLRGLLVRRTRAHEEAFASALSLVHTVQRKSRQRPTLPLSFPSSTIGSEELNFRVRNGIGWGLFDIATGRRGPLALFIEPLDAIWSSKFAISVACSRNGSGELARSPSAEVESVCTPRVLPVRGTVASDPKPACADFGAACRTTPLR